MTGATDADIGSPAGADASEQRTAVFAPQKGSRDMTSYECLLVERPQPGIVLMTLHRPAQLNAVSEALFAEIEQACAEVEANPDDRVLVVTGSGRAFCAGLDMDLAERLLAGAPDNLLATLDRWGTSLMSLRNLSKPVIAAVNGAAAGGGLAISLACDIRIASTEAKFNVAFIKLGFTGGDMGVSYLLPRVVGLGHASELMLTGRFIDADEASRIGLANRVVRPNELIDAALECAAEIVRNDALGVSLTKHVLQRNLGASSLSAAMDLENRNQALMALSGSVANGLEEFKARNAK